MQEEIAVLRFTITTSLAPSRVRTVYSGQSRLVVDMADDRLDPCAATGHQADVDPPLVVCVGEHDVAVFRRGGSSN
ncbi:MAG TPA: hypothetical protein VF266_05705 [Thermoanaerobaculia bacterium]